MRRAAVVLALAVLPGCGGDGGRSDAVRVAGDWLRAVAARDTDRACELMSPSAVDAVRRKYAAAGEAANCTAVVRGYRDAFDEADLEALVGVGLEAEGTVKEGELGVFPVSGPHELQVVLMRRSGDAWKVASTTIDPRGGS